MLTSLEKQLLSLASLTSGPIYSEILCRAAQRPSRGVINVLGRLVSRNILLKYRCPDRYVLNPSFSEDISLIKFDSIAKKRNAQAMLRAIDLWNPKTGYPAVPFQKIELSFIAESRHLLQSVVNGLHYYIDRVDDEMVHGILELCYGKWGNELPEDIERAEQRYLSCVSGFECHWSRTKQLMKTDTLSQKAQLVFDLQEQGLADSAESTLADMEKANHVDSEAFQYCWLQARQCILRNALDEARSWFVNVFRRLDRHRHRRIASLILLDLSRWYGVANNQVRELKCIGLARALVKRGHRPDVRRLAILRTIESNVEVGAHDVALRGVARLFELAANHHWPEAIYYACCHGIRLATLLDRPTEALQYANELTSRIENAPSVLLRRCLLAVQELRHWYPRNADTMLKNINSQIQQRFEVYIGDELPDMQESAAVFLRQSQFLCETLIDQATDCFSSDPEKCQVLLQSARICASRLGDPKKWAKIARLSSDLQESTGVMGEEMYPTGYVAWVNRLLQCQDYDEFLATAQAAIQKILGISSGGFLIRSRGRWSLQESWGKSVSGALMRNFTCILDKQPASKIVEVGEWTFTRFPENIETVGYLCVQLDEASTSSEYYAEAIRAVGCLVRPFAMIREALIRQIPVQSPEPLPVIHDAADRIIGKCSSIAALRDKIRTIAQGPSTLHILGETGTGKELVAEAIHRCSNRRNGPLVVFNCSTSTESMVDSELFGHVRGAFTGAQLDRKGVFQSAHKGTLFLDEVADLPLSTQARLLRVIQERKVRPVGADLERDVDVRIISATHKDLTVEVENGRFRRDLFYRLVVIRLVLPPLRERRGDIPLLVEYFLERNSRKLGRKKVRLSRDAVAWLKEYSWPGNIRELQNLVEVILNFSGEKSIIDSEDLLRWGQFVAPESILSLSQETERFQRELIVRILIEFDWNITRSAQKLGISRQGLFKKMKSMGIIAAREEKGHSG